MVAFELFDAIYGSVVIGRNIANPMAVAKEHFSTQLKVDQVTATVKKAFPLVLVFTLSSFLIIWRFSLCFFLHHYLYFIKDLHADQCGYSTDKVRALL
jgi:hypothetical protein